MALLLVVSDYESVIVLTFFLLLWVVLSKSRRHFISQDKCSLH